MSGFHNSPYKCQFCYLGFNHTDSLIRHLAESHPLSCSTKNSQESFSILKATSAQSQSSSSTYPPVTYDTAISDGPCGESFDTHSNFTECSLGHRGERQFLCDISDCNMSFKSRQALK
eukprot:815166_1